MSYGYYDLVDVEFIEQIEVIDGANGIWAVIATMENGDAIRGTCHGDGFTWIAATFEPDIGEEG